MSRNLERWHTLIVAAALCLWVGALDFAWGGGPGNEKSPDARRQRTSRLKPTKHQRQLAMPICDNACDLATNANIMPCPDITANSNARIRSVAERIAFVHNTANGNDSFCVGFLIAGDLLVTADHCVPQPTTRQNLQISFDNFKNANTRQCYARGTVGHFPVPDFAIIPLNCELGNRGGVVPGSFPRMGDAVTLVAQPSATQQIACSGAVTCLDLFHGAFRHECDQALGRSGSPIVNGAGEVVGMASCGPNCTSQSQREGFWALSLDRINNCRIDRTRCPNGPCAP
jgi:hypothetical protein